MKERRWGAIAAFCLGGMAVLLIAWAMLREHPHAASKKPLLASGKTNLLARESRTLLPKELSSLHLSMSESELLRARPRAKRNEQGKEPAWELFDELLGTDRRVLYMIGTSSRVLDRVQIAMRLPDVAAIEPRLREIGEKLGPPSGVWDCPPGGDMLPTRRFTWRRDPAGVMESYLLLGDSVAVTQMIASADAVRASIQLSRCVPVPPDRFTKFPALPVPEKGGAK